MEFADGGVITNKTITVVLEGEVHVHVRYVRGDLLQLYVRKYTYHLTRSIQLSLASSFSKTSPSVHSAEPSCLKVPTQR